MIRKISSDRASFRTLEFGPGLNILRADKSAGATDRDSRNGAGKTSFVELVHFLFGANAKPKSIFRSTVLREWRFRAEVVIGEQSGSVARSGARPRSFEVSGDLVPATPGRRPLVPGVAPTRTLTLGEWRSFLGCRLFGLPGQTDEESDPFAPTFRSLFPYFARRQESGGFQECERHSTEQQPWGRQVAVSWLLGLDWTISQCLQQLRERERGLRGLKAAAKSGELKRFARGAAELRTALTLARARTERMKKRLAEFRVLPDYEELEEEATCATGELQDLAAEDLADREHLRALGDSLTDEEAPGRSDLRKLYEEAGIVLPELAHRRLDEVDHFHRRVLENRREHLRREMESAEARIAARRARKGRLDNRRRQIMSVLESGGALQEYTALREESARAEADAEGLAVWLRDVERWETARTDARAERARLTKALEVDIRERNAILQKAVLRFGELSQSLYERPGELTIGWSENGPTFEVHIPSGQSRGIANMQIFCFDLMLMELLIERGRSPCFLIHDSHLFDGVDERQVARALQLGARRADECGFQYIVTLNTDALPQEGFDSDFAIENYFMNVRLTDAEEDGGLFGIRFD